MVELSRKLARLAKLHGIEVSYTDMGRRTQRASPGPVLRVLKALGAPVEGMDDVDEALRYRRNELKKRTVEPVIVAWEGRLGPALPKSAAREIVLEDGEAHHGGNLPWGYHTLHTAGGGRTLVISTPSRAYFPGGCHWGAFAPIYALHSERNRHIGSLSEFDSLMQWMSRLGGTVAGTLPMLAAFLDKPFDPSPYAPASRLFWNELYIDTGGGPPEKPSRLVDYRSVMRQKRQALEKMAREFFTRENRARRQFERFVRQHRGVEDYARFRAVTDRLGKGWRFWPARLQEGRIQAGDYDEDTKRYHLYAQWRIQEQLQALAAQAHTAGQMMYLDLPLGLHPDAYDVWHDRESFVPGVAGGAPPDLVFRKGQNWGFPPMHPEAMRLTHHRYTIAYIRNHLQFAKLLRIDHVMALHRLYWIPDGLTGDQGVYIHYPAEELYAILCLESHRNQAGIIGENLGTVPPVVNRSMSRHNIQQMYVVQYEVVGDGLRSVPANCAASVNTHDMPPFHAFLEGLDIDDRVDLGLLRRQEVKKERQRRSELKEGLIAFLRRKRLLQPGRSGAGNTAIFRATINFLAASKARIALINLEDLWQENHPQNIPATTTERPNWRRRMRYGMKQIEQLHGIKEFLQNVSARRSRSSQKHRVHG